MSTKTAAVPLHRRKVKLQPVRILYRKFIIGSYTFEQTGDDTVHEIDFEWTATMYNINAGHNDSLLNACQPLQQYSLFVGKIHQGRLAGLSLDAALSQAVDYGIEKNFFDGLLRKLKGDVMSILFKEYTDEEANALFYNDGHDVGYDEGYSAGVAEQRAKDEAEIAAQAAEITRLKTEITKLTGNL